MWRDQWVRHSSLWPQQWILAETHDCHEFADFTDNNGDLECACPDGFNDTSADTGLDIGRNCSDIDECADPALNDCGTDNAECINIPGGFNCTCADGYEGDGIICENIYECTPVISLMTVTPTPLALTMVLLTAPVRMVLKEWTAYNFQVESDVSKFIMVFPSWLSCLQFHFVSKLCLQVDYYQKDPTNDRVKIKNDLV